MKTPDQLEAWEMTDHQSWTLVGILAHHLVHIDPLRLRRAARRLHLVALPREHR